VSGNPIGRLARDAPTRSPRAARTLVTLALAGVTLGLHGMVGAAPAVACSCMQPPPPQEALAQSDHVFEGLVHAVDGTGEGGGDASEGGAGADGSSGPDGALPAPGGSRVRVTFEVVRTWKGADAERFEVRTADNSAACGYPFEPGETYLVYADDGDDGAPTTGLCSRTRPVEAAEQDLDVLGAGVVPVDIEGEGAGDPSQAAGAAEGAESFSGDPSPRAEGSPAPAPAAPGQGGCAGCSLAPAARAAPFLTVAVPLAILSRRRRPPQRRRPGTPPVKVPSPRCP